MVTTASKSVKVWGRGQLTIPKEMRAVLKLDEESRLNMFVIGQCLVLTPKPLMRAALSREVSKSLDDQGLKLKDLLNDLKKERRRYNREKYGG